MNNDSLTVRDVLAQDRTMLALERTLLAYVRTALTFLISGSALVKFFDHWAFLLMGWGLFVLSGLTLALGVMGFLRRRILYKRCEQSQNTPSSSRLS